MTRDIIFFISAILYFPAIYAIKVYMANQPYEFQRNVNMILKFPNAMWHLGLSIFNTLGGYHTIIQLYRHGINCEYTTDTYWIDLFCMSKVFELMNTVFIVVRGRQLVLLQYYHQYAAFLLCWVANKVYPPELFGGAIMNYSVHSILYLYHFLLGIGYSKVRKYSVFITIFQALQMITALYVLVSRKMYACVENRHVDINMIYWYTFMMCTSHGVLFGQLFWKKMQEKWKVN